MEEGGIVGVLLEAERDQVQVRLDLGPKQTADVGECRYLETGSDLLRHTGAADDGPAL